MSANDTSSGGEGSLTPSTAKAPAADSVAAVIVKQRAVSIACSRLWLSGNTNAACDDPFAAAGDGVDAPPAPPPPPLSQRLHAALSPSRRHSGGWDRQAADGTGERRLGRASGGWDRRAADGAAERQVGRRGRGWAGRVATATSASNRGSLDVPCTPSSCGRGSGGSTAIGSSCNSGSGSVSGAADECQVPYNGASATATQPRRHLHAASRFVDRRSEDGGRLRAGGAPRQGRHGCGCGEANRHSMDVSTPNGWVASALPATDDERGGDFSRSCPRTCHAHTRANRQQPTANRRPPTAYNRDSLEGGNTAARERHSRSPFMRLAAL
eukprot:365806-Chlamydomonas_euryale.AAC.4